MNKFRIFLAFALAGCVMAGCHSNIDLDNVDGQAEIGMGVVLPVGSITFTVKDLLPTNANIYFDSLGNKGVLTLKANKQIDRNYHQIDLSEYVTPKNFTLNIHDKMADQGMLPYGNTVIGNGEAITLKFPVNFKLDGINSDNSWERLDSALIDSARFTSILNTQNFDDLKWEYLERIDLNLGGRFKVGGSSNMNIYTKGQAGGYGQTLPLDVNDFTLCMMKNPDLNPKSDWASYNDNVYDTCKFTLSFKIRIPAGQPVNVPNDASITYNLGIKFIDYTALWGMFDATDQMRDQSSLALDNLFGDIGFLKDANLPFADPSIKVDIVTQVAGALVLTADYLYTVDHKGQRTYAEFGNSHVYKRHFEEGEYLDPITSTIGDSTTNMKLLFDKDAARGRVDRLFATTPDSLSYKWQLKFDFQETPQIRITNNSSIRLKSEAVLPMVFNEGVKIEATDTIKDIDLSKASIKALQDSVKLIDSINATDLKLFLKAASTIPLTVKAKFRFLDQNNNEIMVKDSTGATVPLKLFASDTVTINPPKMTYANGAWSATPSENAIFANVNNEKLNHLPDIKAIEYSMWVDDKALDYAYKQGNFNVKITNDAYIKLHIGLTAFVDAILNFTGDKNNNNK